MTHPPGPFHLLNSSFLENDPTLFQSINLRFSNGSVKEETMENPLFRKDLKGRRRRTTWYFLSSYFLSSLSLSPPSNLSLSLYHLSSNIKMRFSIFAITALASLVAAAPLPNGASASVSFSFVLAVLCYPSFLTHFYQIRSIFFYPKD